MKHRQLLRVIALLGAAAAGIAAPVAASFAQIASNAPAWAQDMAPGTWRAISLNTIESVDPSNDSNANPSYPSNGPWSGDTGQKGVTIAWNGGALATGFPVGGKGSLLAWGGGHRDYYGNEVYAFDLATQRWSRLSNPYTNTVFPVTDGIWPDGSPSVPHTYSLVGYHPGTNSFVSMTTQVSNQPSRAAVPVFFDLDTRKWSRGPRNSESINTGGWTVYDPSRDVFWTEGGGTGTVFAAYSMNGNGTSGNWTNHTAKFSALDSRAARDPVRDLVVVTTFNQNSNVSAIDLKNPSASAVRLTQGGSVPSLSGKNAWEWSDTLGAFVYWRSGSGVHQLKPPSGDWRTGTWQWSPLTSGSNSVTPSEPTNGVYNRFRLVRYADVEVGVVVNHVDGAVYAFRLPGQPAPLPRAPTDVRAQ
jgi:hypothetical protein